MSSQQKNYEMFRGIRQCKEEWLQTIKFWVVRRSKTVTVQAYWQRVKGYELVPMIQM